MLLDYWSFVTNINQGIFLNKNVILKNVSIREQWMLMKTYVFQQRKQSISSVFIAEHADQNNLNNLLFIINQRRGSVTFPQQQFFRIEHFYYCDFPQRSSLFRVSFF